MLMACCGTGLRRARVLALLLRATACVHGARLGHPSAAVASAPSTLEAN
jgi:hypothetical protein